MLQLPEINTLLLDFVERNATADPVALRLSSDRNTEGFDKDFAITQVEARRKASSKLKDYIARREFIFPDALSAEQATHQTVARFHASLIAPESRVLDMTCGLGIDAFEIARKGCYVTTLDLDTVRAATAAYNANILNIDNLTVLQGDSVDFLQKNDDWDCIIVDPARRDSQKRRTYALKDCLPDVTAISSLLTEKAPKVLIKASPMLDIAQAVRELPYCSRIFAVSFKGECKEVLIELSDCFDGTPEIIAVILGYDEEIRFSVSLSDLGTSAAPKAELPKLLTTGSWLYEPDPAVMKMGAWKSLENQFPDLCKLAANTHIFVSNTCYTNFPGRVLRIKSIFSPNSKEAKSMKGEKWNIVSRNAPLTPEQLKKKLGLRDGGPNFLYYFSAEGSRPLLATGEPMR